ncbi:hypothetical protein [Absiella sp. AM29-15]|uniref:hypothetical protein n=3 Tax=unclassified Amedibacterium TaxID=3088137 RepID=UPI0011C1A473|nr:hypothetical protein [Absiella sp. AM29-15]
MRKNEKGSSLIFALAVISIITIVIAACMAISYSYYKRSIVANSERQAYLTAKSVLTNVIEQITDNTCENHAEYLKMIPDETVNTKIEYDVNFPNDMKKDMGNVQEISVVRSKEEKDVKVGDTQSKEVIDKVTFTVTANYGDRSKTISADIVKLNSDKSDSWQLSKYYEGVIEANNNITNALAMRKQMTDINDIFIKSKNFSDVKNFLKEDNEIWQRYLDHETEMTYYNNDLLRPFFFYGYYNQQLPKFDITKVITKDEDAWEYLNNNVCYIKPFFNFNKYEICIVYANIDNNVSKNWKTQLIFNHDDGHWYFLKSEKSLTTFNDNKGDGGQKKWDDFVKNTLNDPSKAVKLD